MLWTYSSGFPETINLSKSPEQNKPIEDNQLSILKRHLANISCKHYLKQCRVYPKDVPIQARPPKELGINKQVQVNGFGCVMDNCIEVLSLVFQNESFRDLNKLNVDSNQHVNKLILKDEELETDNAMFSRDEGTDNPLSLLDSSTSSSDTSSWKFPVVTHCDLSKCRNVALCRNYKTKLIPNEIVLDTFIASIRPPFT